MVMMDPQAVAELPLWWSGLLLTGGAMIGAMIVEWTARKLIPHGVRVEHNAVASAVFTKRRWWRMCFSCCPPLTDQGR